MTNLGDLKKCIMLRSHMSARNTHELLSPCPLMFFCAFFPTTTVHCCGKKFAQYGFRSHYGIAALSVKDIWERSVLLIHIAAVKKRCLIFLLLCKKCCAKSVSNCLEKYVLLRGGVRERHGRAAGPDWLVTLARATGDHFFRPQTPCLSFILKDYFSRGVFAFACLLSTVLNEAQFQGKKQGSSKGKNIPKRSE